MWKVIADADAVEETVHKLYMAVIARLDEMGGFPADLAVDRKRHTIRVLPPNGRVNAHEERHGPIHGEAVLDTILRHIVSDL